MTASAPFAGLPPAVAFHLVAALAALALGPLALAARKGSRGHRGLGYAWVTLMLGAALSSLFIRSFGGWHWAGYTPIHLLTLATLGGLAVALRRVARGDIAGHRAAMWSLYLGACVVAGALALLPGRLLGRWLWAPLLG